MSLQLKQVKAVPVRIPESHRMHSANQEEFNTTQMTRTELPSDEGRSERPSRNTSSKEQSAAAENAPESVFDAKNRFSKMESRVALSAFGLIVFVLGAAWFSWDEQYAIVGNSDAAYNYGLVGGIMMLVILIYSLRKRVKALRKSGDIRYWYYFHFLLGVVGPVLIILHTSFHVRSINAGVALFAMLFVVFSGFIGRYIYTRASFGLRSQERDLKVVTENISGGVLNSKSAALKHIEQRLKEFTAQQLSAPRGFGNVVQRIVTAGYKARWAYFKINGPFTRALEQMSQTERWTSSEFKQRLSAERRAIRAHLNKAASVGKFQAYEKLAGRWRMLHVPLLYLLLLSGLVHVLAVHMYR